MGLEKSPTVSMPQFPHLHIDKDDDGINILLIFSPFRSFTSCKMDREAWVMGTSSISFVDLPKTDISGCSYTVAAPVFGKTIEGNI